MPRKVYLYTEEGERKYVSAQDDLSSGEARFFVANWYKKEKAVKVTLEEDDGAIIKEFDVRK
ncbi:MAG TPA: hypothetical protein DEP57_00335 [Selenomonas sp.]|nr:hypothetical protein [Selenomonas sp.]